MEDKAIDYEDALKIVRSIKAVSDEEGAKIVQQIAETAQDKIIEYLATSLRSKKK